MAKNKQIETNKPQKTINALQNNSRFCHANQLEFNVTNSERRNVNIQCRNFGQNLQGICK